MLARDYSRWDMLMSICSGDQQEGVLKLPSSLISLSIVPFDGEDNITKENCVFHSNEKERRKVNEGSTTRINNRTSQFSHERRRSAVSFGPTVVKIIIINEKEFVFAGKLITCDFKKFGALSRILSCSLRIGSDCHSKTILRATLHPLHTRSSLPSQREKDH